MHLIRKGRKKKLLKAECLLSFPSSKTGGVENKVGSRLTNIEMCPDGWY